MDDIGCSRGAWIREIQDPTGKKRKERERNMLVHMVEGNKKCKTVTLERAKLDRGEKEKEERHIEMGSKEMKFG